MANQFGRKATLVVSSGSLGLDLSEMRFTFQTRNSDVETPNTLHVRIYNLKPQTVQKIGTEYNTITLQAGYERGNFGVIFSGAIKQVATGRENNVDSYVDIWGADGDLWYTDAVVNETLAAGATQQDVIAAILSAKTSTGTNIKFAEDATGLISGAGLGLVGATSRGRVLWGMARDYARDWANTNGFRWSLQNGEFVVVPITGYRPGEAVVLSSTTGLVGVPEVTDDGVHVRALLNPLIRIGCLVQIAQADINRITMQQQGLSYGSPSTAIVTTAAGFYRVMQAEFFGDSRGNDWYVDLMCLAVDVTVSDQSKSVSATGLTLVPVERRW